MGVQRKNYTAAFKAKVALQAIMGQQAINEIAAEHGLHPNLVTGWKSSFRVMRKIDNTIHAQ